MICVRDCLCLTLDRWIARFPFRNHSENYTSARGRIHIVSVYLLCYVSLKNDIANRRNATENTRYIFIFTKWRNRKRTAFLESQEHLAFISLIGKYVSGSVQQWRSKQLLTSNENCNHYRRVISYDNSVDIWNFNLDNRNGTS